MGEQSNFSQPPADREQPAPAVGGARGFESQAASFQEQAHLLDLAYDGIIARDRQSGLILFWNHGAEEMYGWRKDEALGKNCQILLKTEFPEPEGDIETELFKTGHWEGELIHTRADGKQIVVASRWALHKDAQGALPMLLEINQDITERKRAEIAIARLRRQRELILNSAGEGIFGVDQAGRLTFVNPAAARLLAYAPEMLVGSPLERFLGAEVRPDLLKALREGTAAQGAEASFYRADGQALPIEYVSTPMRENGEDIGTVITFKDITERKQAEAALQKRSEELRLANEALRATDHYKDEFLSVISHELRTPLNFIMGFASLLEDGAAGVLLKEQLEFVGKILEGADRMLLLVNDLLDFAKIQAGKLYLQWGPTDYTSLVEEVLSSLKPLVTQRGLTLESNIQPSEPLCLDARRMVQVLTNLVSNAIKFTPAGGRIIVRAFARGDDWVCEVEDTGIGIAKEDVPKLFTRFRQLDMSTTREQGGTGLGLSISKAIVEAHEGSIEVESEPGRGSTFRFIVPRRSADDGRCDF